MAVAAWPCLWAINCALQVSAALDAVLFLFCFFFLALGAFGGLIGLGGLLVAAYRRRSLATWAFVVGVAFVAASWFPAMTHFGWPLRRLAFERAAVRATPLVEAIARYTRDVGAPPPDLSALVPVYVPAVPWTGLPAYPSFTLRPAVVLPRTLHYDLGSPAHFSPRGDRARLFPELHSSLNVDVDADGEVRKVATDFIPPFVPGLHFEPGQWKADVDARVTVARDLAASGVLVGRSEPGVVDLLGPPTSTVDAHGTPWQLVVECSMGFLNWDVFMYWPTQDYPEQGFGGTIERIGEWAYVHE